MDVRIDRIGALGDGIAETENGPVYVPDALPGERVRIDKFIPRGDGVRAVTREILLSSQDRVTPLCRHFGTCGGCVAQHMETRLYTEWKRDLVGTTLRRAGLDAVVRAPFIFPVGSRRRVRLAFREVQGRFILGFRKMLSDHIVDIDDCTVATSALVAFLPALKEFLYLFGKRGEVSVTETYTGLDVVVFVKKEPDLNLRMDAPKICKILGISRLSWAGSDKQPEPILVAAEPAVRFGDSSVKIPPASFLQPTVAGEIKLRELVLAATERSNAVADLYAGCGSFSLPLAAAGKSVHAVEAVASQTAAIRKSGGHRGITTETRDLARQPLRVTELERFDAVVMDPPRAGAGPQIAQIAASSVPLIVYVSCNPATFARDARVLADEGFEMGAVQPVDQFLWSHHVELSAVFRRG
ncbi:MAG: class I SAM-dependent RNA methyltransferase [Pseudomonadota bacterium]|nr:class I SAM-dependent RNA methyltransferase [Pseudomonadota bacterium]